MPKYFLRLSPSVVVTQVRFSFIFSEESGLMGVKSSGHLQTMYCVTGDFTKSDKVKYERQATS
jgi:predicted alpha/beta-fold hydrolase